MRLLVSAVLLAFAGYGIWFFGSTHPELRNKVEEFVDSGSFNTLEVRYTADQIMENHRAELLKDGQHRYLEPQIKFYPYLLMEVKYTVSHDKTSEGVILWDLTDGEMVLNTDDWEKTHGFQDCIRAKTGRNEFKILSILAKKGGSIDREGLARILHVEDETLDSWMEGLRRKQLIVQAGNRYRLHLQNPKLKTVPETKLDERLVTKPFRNALRVSRTYNLRQIEQIAMAAFGNDFTIRRTLDVYLPVHCITVENPDGTLHSSNWNALNGRPISSGSWVY